MRVGFSGWAKDHGLKQMAARTLKSEDIVEDPFPMEKGTIKAKVLRPDEDMADGVRLYFSSDLRLGGDQLGQIQLSTKELMRMLKATMKDRPLDTFIKLYEAV